ncbi:MAG: penicillin-binding protein [Anaerolineales bacterium]|nr:penicillin-binding protein [Anaerolineales bacterium]
MPNPNILIRRRNQRKSSTLPTLARLSLALLTVLALALAGSGVAVARLYLEVTQIVPAVEDIEAYFERGERARFSPIEVVDRNGDLLFELTHPRAERAEWVGLDDEAPIQAPNHLVSALIAAQDPTFFENPGYVPRFAAAGLVGDLTGRGERPRERTITEQLVAVTLLPVEDYADFSFRRDFRLLLLAERLTQRYEKRQILTWYMNSAYFGRGIYGVDSAALVYFGKHADGLSLAESALLASRAGERSDDHPTPANLRSDRNGVLELMTELGMITARQSRAARAESVDIRSQALEDSRDPTLVPLTHQRLTERMGSDILRRGGLTVHMTLDRELQAQARCVLATQMRRLGGADPTVTVPASGGQPCTAAGFLPPLRPGDTGIDHQVEAASAVVYSPPSGEVLAVTGLPDAAGAQLVNEPVPAGQTVYPFVYLTAFSRGFGPGSMVLDLPQETDLSSDELAAYEGPVRMRRALVGGLEAAGRRTLELAGLQNVLRTLGPLGLIGPEDRRPTADEIIDGEVPVDPLTLTQAYGVVANRGQRVGTSRDSGQLQPVILKRVVDRFGRTVYESDVRSQSILGEGLAYLLVDVLRDESARRPVFGEANPFGIGRPAGTMAARGEAGTWTVGFTPNIAVGIWLGNPDGNPTHNLTAVNGPGSVWHALARQATLGEPPEGWTRPPSVSRVEVCVPSGLLPSEHCPIVAEELFLQGTEPTTVDHLYQPFRVNRSTGRLATLQTPLSLVEEQVYLVPPPEAAAWAEAAGIERPPTEFDPLPAEGPDFPGVGIESPEPFAVISGRVSVQGEAHPDEFVYYRLQYGQGLNPSRWTQIGDDETTRVWGGSLGTWETDGLSGLYTLQLLVVDSADQVRTASVPVKVDGEPPSVEVLLPLPDERVSIGEQQSVMVEVRAQDDVGVERVEFYLDALQVAVDRRPPYFVEIDIADLGRHSFHAVAVDQAGRRTESEVVEFLVVP